MSSLSSSNTPTRPSRTLGGYSRCHRGCGRTTLLMDLHLYLFNLVSSSPAPPLASSARTASSSPSRSSPRASCSSPVQTGGSQQWTRTLGWCALSPPLLLACWPPDLPTAQGLLLTLGSPLWANASSLTGNIGSRRGRTASRKSGTRRSRELPRHVPFTNPEQGAAAALLPVRGSHGRAIPGSPPASQLTHTLTRHPDHRRPARTVLPGLHALLLCATLRRDIHHGRGRRARAGAVHD